MYMHTGKFLTDSFYHCIIEQLKNSKTPCKNLRPAVVQVYIRSSINIFSPFPKPYVDCECSKSFYTSFIIQTQKHVIISL